MFDNGLYYGDLLNRNHPLNKGVVLSLLCVPWYMSGPRWLDISGNRLHGTLTNTPTWSAARGRPGGFGSMRFAGGGSDQHVVVSHNAAFNFNDEIFTWMLWMWPDSETTAYILNKNAGGTGGWGLYKTSSTGLNVIINGDVDLTMSGAYTVGAWQHIAVTSNGTTIRLYRNGTESINAARDRDATDTSSSLLIGIGFSGLFDFDGGLDDIRLYGRELSAADVKLYYNLSRLGYPGLLNRVSLPRAVAEAAAAGGATPYVVGGGVGGASCVIGA